MSKSLSERKRYAAYIGEQEMDTVKFEYLFRFVDAATGGLGDLITQTTDGKLTQEEAWQLGRSKSLQKLSKVTEIITVSANIEGPNAEKAASEAGQGHSKDASSIPEDTPPATPAKHNK